MKKIYYSIVIFSVLLFASCDDWLDISPKDKITEAQAYSSIATINSVIADIYNRLPDIGGIQQSVDYYTQLDEGISGGYVNNFEKFPLDYWTYYDYTLIRDINTHLVNIDGTSFLSDKEKKYYKAEARLLRVYVYFELVKRMGGVPLITEVMGFESDVDLSTYQIPRSKESDIYDFIESEIDAIKEDLNLTPTVQYNRASKGLALAIKARAMLYAGTLAKYNSMMELPVVLPGGEVGIPADKAQGYLQQSLNAVQELENMNYYHLYNNNSDKSKNFFEVLTKSPAENNEIIFINEFTLPNNVHGWTLNNIARTLRDGGAAGLGGSAINPSLNLVDAFEMTDNSNPRLTPYTNPDHPDETVGDNALDADPSAYIYYNNLNDIFSKKDPRLFGTIITPGQSFAGKDLQVQAGIAYYNPKTSKLEFQAGTLDNQDNPNNIFTIDGNPVIVDGSTVKKTKDDGPAKEAAVSHTGFYVKKSMDENLKDILLGSPVQFVRYRYAEVLLNGAEAAFELGQKDVAANYINQIRRRAGMPEKTSPTLEDIRNERRVELAFEGLRFYDIKRWRIAHVIFDGDVGTKTAMMYGLWPYKVYRPGDQTHNKWIYVRRAHPSVFTIPRKFITSNYYSAFPAEALKNNPKLVKNPGQ